MTMKVGRKEGTERVCGREMFRVVMFLSDQFLLVMNSHSRRRRQG